jgi:hypothetical protein
MVVPGDVRNGVVVPDGNVRLPEGQEVTVVTPRAGPAASVPSHRLLVIPPVSFGTILRPLTLEDDLLDEMLQDRPWYTASTPISSQPRKWQKHPEHAAARAIVSQLIGTGGQVAIAPQVLAEFIHIVTDPRRPTHPLGLAASRRIAEQWWTARDFAQVFPGEAATRQFLV